MTKSLTTKHAKRASKARLPRLRGSRAQDSAQEQTRSGNRTEWSCGATRVGTLLGRVRLHLDTDRFLAALRRDAMWEAGCDYAALALERLASRLDRKTLARPLRPRVPAIRARAALTAPVLQRHPRRGGGTRKAAHRATSRLATRVTRAVRAVAGAAR